MPEDRSARRGLETAEDAAERICDNWECVEQETLREGHRYSMVRQIAAAIRARDQAVLEQVAKIVESDSWLVAGRAIRAFARELAHAEEGK